MNNKNTVLAVVAALILLLLGAGAFFLSQKKTPTPSNNQEMAKPTTTTNSAQQTLKDLLSSKNPVKCTYSTDVSGAKISGVVYVANGKVRGDFTTTSGKTEITGHMATDAKYMYSWTEGSKQGYKFSLDSMTNPKPTTTTNQNKAPDLNQKFNYSCSPWTLDSKMLELPTDVTFTLFTIPTAPTGTSGGSGVSNQTMCTACSSLKGESKTQCLTQLHCN
ncbi:MAG TPA: hypothetical protein VES68_02475 [Candidatus Sulfotelmatobacter sp.]|nr:hypothetical protein [Candidatus Sulfotelmatobacter sp.]